MIAHSSHPVPTLRVLVNSASSYVRDVLNVRLSSEPFVAGRATLTMDHLWATLRQKLNEGQVAIIGISGHLNHWTVAHRATKKSIRLFDSDLLTQLRRSQCSLRSIRVPHQIDPDEIFLLRREPSDEF